MAINKKMVNGVAVISKSIIDAELEGEKLFKNPRALAKYNELILPQIDNYKIENNDTPNNLLDEFLQKYIKKKNLNDDYQTNKFQFHGFKMNTHIWACITRKYPDITKLKYANSPQLYILINIEGIKFGFDYGKHVKNDDYFVKNVKKEYEILKNIIEILDNNKNLRIYSKSIGTKLPVLKDQITPKSPEDIRTIWSKDTIIVESYRKEDIPNDIEERITKAFNNLLPLFHKISEIEVEEQKDIMVPETNNEEIKLGKKVAFLHLWKKVLENQSSGVHFSTKERHEQRQKMKEDAILFIREPTFDIFSRFWNKLDAAQRVARAKNIWDNNSTDTLVEVISEMIANKDFKLEWGTKVKFARRTLWELFGILHIEDTPPLNSCSETGLKFFNRKVSDRYEDVLNNFKEFKDNIYLKEIGHVTQNFDYEVPINFEIDQLFNVIDKSDDKSISNAKTDLEKELYRKVIELKEKGVEEEVIEERSINYFWITVNPNIWRIEKIKDGGSVFYTAYNTKWNKRRIYSAFEKILPGDRILFYIATPIKKVVAIGEALEGMHKEDIEDFDKPVDGIRIRYIKEIEPIDWSSLKDIETLKESSPIKNGAQGSLFELTKDEYESILAIEEPEPRKKRQWKDVKSNLKIEFDKINFEIKKLHFETIQKTNMQKQISAALRAGKHIILIGPPGTGKSKLAKEIYETYCRKESKKVEINMSTATSDWSTFETIGGYRPNKDSMELEFNPGIFLRCFQNDDKDPINKWLILDEINRADIDKAFGSLFSALTGDDIILPFETSEGRIKIIGEPDDNTEIRDYHYFIHPDWRFIATMNTFDKSSLYEMSYAFMRRFAFIPVGIPKTIDKKLIKEYLRYWDPKEKDKHDDICEDLAELWKLINEKREIGPAIIEDFYRYVKNTKDEDYVSPIMMYVFPQFEGLSKEKQRGFIKKVKELKIIKDEERLIKYAEDFFDLEIKLKERTE